LIDPKLESKVNKLYRYLKAKHHYNKDFWREQTVSKSEIRNKLMSGASHIDGVSLNSKGNMDCDTGNYPFQLEWEFNYDRQRND